MATTTLALKNKSVGHKAAAKGKPVAKKHKKVEPAAVGKPVQAAQGELHKRAMLVKITVRRWHSHATDEVVTADVAVRNKAKSGSGDYRKRLIPLEAMADIRTLEQSLRKLNYSLTLPFDNDGWRLMSSQAYFIYRDKITAMKNEYLAACKKFLSAWPEHVKNAALHLGTMYRAGEYPTVNELEDKFGVDMHVRAIPSGENFMVDIGDEEAAKVKADCDALVAATIETAVKDIWTRTDPPGFKMLIGRMIERLKAYKVTKDGVEGKFRDSLVSNIVELLDIVPLINITGDAQITAFCDEIRAGLVANSAEVLRDDEKIRLATVAKAEAIFEKMQGFFA